MILWYISAIPFVPWNQPVLLSCICPHNGCACISSATLSAHYRVTIHKRTLRKGVYKCIRIHHNHATKAETLCASAGRTHWRSPGGPSCACSACSATARFGWSKQRKAHADADVALPAHRAMSMLLSTIWMI